jgi:hypothetical protein
LDSDQESTDGEDASVQRGDSLDNLNPNNLLFRAARVHNLPVMSQALAIGARVDAELQVSALQNFFFFVTANNKKISERGCF